ncbi:hypothetical protein L218DRAFT_1007590 [Marasmius fiardii PR-910]|nr:hypothetical protein L218DRAFT_1007590 [Marasmius fiardii PR-910]
MYFVLCKTCWRINNSQEPFAENRKAGADLAGYAANECLMIENVKKLGDHPVCGGGFGDVWKGKIGEQVLLKEYVQKKLLSGNSWNPNLLLSMGMYYLDEARKQLCLVSPWMEQGNLAQCLEAAPSKDIDRYSLVYDVASGLQYLHSRKITSRSKILLPPREELASEISGYHGSQTIRREEQQDDLHQRLLRTDPPSTSTTSSVIYAYAYVCYEVPFYELTDSEVIVAVLSERKCPSRPQDMTPLNDDMWNIMLSCWNTEPHFRPSATEVHTSTLMLRENVKRPLSDTLDLSRKRKLDIAFHLHLPDLRRSPAEGNGPFRRISSRFMGNELAHGLADLLVRVTDEQKLKLHSYGSLPYHNTPARFTSTTLTRDLHAYLFEKVIFYCFDPEELSQYNDYSRMSITV